MIRTRPFFWTTFGARDLEPFHHFEVDHNAPCFPPTFRITFVSYLSRVLSEEKSEDNGHRKIPKISPGAYIFQRPFLRGLFLEGLIYGGKFAFQNRLG